jgi:hypothetical protein
VNEVADAMRGAGGFSIRPQQPAGGRHQRIVEHEMPVVTAPLVFRC